MISPTSVSVTDAQSEAITQLQAQVTTLEELLQLYEECATEQEQRLQKTLRALEERALQLEHAQSAMQTLQTILDSMGDAVVVIDQKGQVLFGNPAAKTLLQKNALAESFYTWIETYDVFRADGISPYGHEELPLSRAIHGESVDGEEIRVVEPDTGYAQWLSVNARPLQAEQDANKRVGAVAVFRDIGQRKAFEEELQRSHQNSQQQAQLLKNTLSQLQQTQAQLIQGEKMASLGQTVAGIAHEINNPINFIHGNLKPAQQALSDLTALIKLFQETYIEPTPAIAEAIAEIDLPFLAKDIPNMLKSMQVGTERIREIVKSLRIFSRLDEAEFKKVDIHQGIDSALMILQSKLKASPRQVEICIHKQYGKLPLLECHASQLNQVFVNLLSNAIEALEGKTDSSKIVIQTECLADTVTIKVSDNGIGIPEEIQTKIFDPFFTTKPVGKGIGLGLSVCYQSIVETHSGTLECVSTVGVGTEFTIEIPIKAAA